MTIGTFIVNDDLQVVGNYDNSELAAYSYSSFYHSLI